MSLSASSGLMTKPESWQYAAFRNFQPPVHVSTSASTKQAPMPLFNALPLRGTHLPDCRMTLPFDLTSSAKLVLFLGSSIDEMIPSLVRSFTTSTFKTSAARLRRSLRSLSAATQTAPPWTVVVTPPNQYWLGGVSSESPQSTRMR